VDQTVESLQSLLELKEKVNSMSQIPDHFEKFMEATKYLLHSCIAPFPLEKIV
jgi:hypothetical protein